MGNLRNEKAEKLRAISKCISEMELPERAQSLSLQKAGHYIEDALNLGAFNRPEHTALRTEIKVLLSQPKEEMEPHISAWAVIVSQLKPKKSQFPSVDIVKDFPSDRKIVAKTILEEAEAIEQTDLAKLKPKRIIPAILISSVIILLFELFVYFGPFIWLKNHPNSYGIQGSVICLVPCLIFGFFKPRWRNYCWGTAALAFFALILSLLGGRSR